MFKIYHPSFENEFKTGKGELSGESLVVLDKNGKELIRWPLSSLTFEKSGASNSLIQISCPSAPDYTAFTRDWDLMKQIKSRSPDVKIPRKNLIDSGFSMVVAAIIIFGSILIGLYQVKEPLVDLVVYNIPSEWEAKMGDVAVNQLVGMSATKHADIAKDLETIMAPLIEQVESGDLKVKVYVVEDKSLNAFALPGGHIAFHTGLLNKANDVEMVLGVAAHELAHVTHRHGLKGLVNGLGIFLVIQTLFGDFTGLAAVLADNSQVLLRQYNSREAEREADRTGLKYLNGAGLSARGLYDFFDVMLQEKSQSEKSLEGAMNLLSTHPTTDERMKWLESHVDRDSNWLDNDESKQKLWQSIKARLLDQSKDNKK